MKIQSAAGALALKMVRAEIRIPVRQQGQADHGLLVAVYRVNAGSIGTVCYFANGFKELPKEYVEVHQSGQSAMVRAFIDRIKTGGSPLIPVEELTRVTQVTFAAGDAIRNRQAYGV